MNPKVVKVKRRKKFQVSAGVAPMRSTTLERTKRLILAAIRVWEAKRRTLE
jgi:hypothetical protein